MLPVTISTTDPVTGAEVSVPPQFLKRIHRAGEILDEELGELTPTFGVTARWQFRRDPAGGVGVDLRLAAAHPRPVEVGPFVFTAAALADDDTIRPVVRGWASKLWDVLWDLVGERLTRLQERIHQDQAALAAVSEE